MSGYLALSIVFLVPAVLLQVLAWRRRPAHHLRALLVAIGVVCLLTAVFDSVMIAVGLFTYAEDSLLGPRIGLAPVEDFAYPVATALVCTALWNLPDRRADDGPSR